MKKELFQLIEYAKTDLFGLSDYIYQHPETAFCEFQSCKAMVDFLKKFGFDIEERAGGLETAFTASVCPTGEKFPCIDILAEYDALGLGESYGEDLGIAHACGHNLIAAVAAGTGIGLCQIMKKHKIPGTLRVVGTPAEEAGGGKIILQEKGIFEQTDALLMIHPTSGTSKIAGRCRCSTSLRVTYTGYAAHAGNHRQRGINAQDAANICYTSIGCLRHQLPDEVQVFVTMTGTYKEQMLIPDKANLQIAIRCFAESNLESTKEKVKGCIKAGALATGCKVEIEEKRGYLGRICNYTLERVLRKNVEELEEPLMLGMVDDNGGEDFGNLNRKTPGIMFYPTLLPERKISNHTLAFYELCNSDKSREVILLGSRALAYTALDLYMDPSIIEEAKKELEEMLQKESGE